MCISLAYTDDCSAYPGRYVPLPEIEDLLNDKNRHMAQPAINMNEYDNYFKVEVSLPGVHKQDILILIEDNILTIKVIHKDSPDSASKPRIHEFDVNYFERQISLPEEADAEFITAEYRDGILTLIISKIAEQSRSHPNRIVIY